MADTLVPLLSLGVGALLGGLSQALVSRYASFKESKGMAEALDAELTAIQRVIGWRDYLAELQTIVERLNDPAYEPTHEDIFGIRLSQNYFQVFDSLCPKIGLLGNMSGRVVSVYTLGKALIEDLVELQKIQNKMLRSETPVERQRILDYTKSIITHFQLIQRESDLAVRELREYQSQRWLGIFS